VVRLLLSGKFGGNWEVFVTIEIISKNLPWNGLERPRKLLFWKLCVRLKFQTQVWSVITASTTRSVSDVPLSEKKYQPLWKTRSQLQLAKFITATYSLCCCFFFCFCCYRYMSIPPSVYDGLKTVAGLLTRLLMRVFSDSKQSRSNAALEQTGLKGNASQLSLKEWTPR